MITINTPNIGEDTLEITEIMVNIGDKININQSLLIAEGDKSSIEIPSPYSGIITKIHIKIGDKVQTGSLILSIDTHNYDYVQSINDEKNILKQPNTKINQFNKHNITHDVQYNTTSITSTNLIIHATPLIRHMTRKFGIDLSKIKGSGRKGRIIKEDIFQHLNMSVQYMYQNQIFPLKKDQSTIFNLKPNINFNKFGDTKTIELNKIQKKSGINLQHNWRTIPHVTQFDMIDVTDLEIFRKNQNLEIEKQKMNYKITILIFVIKAVAKALEELPRFNSSLSQDGNTLILKKYINIGIAVDTKQGLLVPVLRDVNKKGIIILSKELLEISCKARTKNQLTPFDMQGGTFTISNIGSIGGTAFTPIINAPEVAILGISKSSINPIWNGKKITPRLMLPVSLSYDHRVIDGADGARFMKLINQFVSDIRLLSM